MGVERQCEENLIRVKGRGEQRRGRNRGAEAHGVHVDATLRLQGMKAEEVLSDVTYHCFLFLVLLILEKW